VKQNAAASTRTAAAAVASDNGALRMTIGRTARIMLAAAGLASWIGGGTASFLGQGGAGGAALIVAGAVCLVMSLVGRWPSRISVSGNELSWDAVKETVESQIESAESSESADSSKVELKILLDRLTALQQTGMAPDPPAEVFDQGVEAAIERLLPGADIVRSQPRGKDTPDYVVRYDGDELFVETKWRADPDAPFRGRTLPGLLDSLRGRGKLLVVANANEDRVTQAQDLVSEVLGGDGKVVGWRDVRDDPMLARALTEMLNS
jgi:hypothetical protein